MKRTILLTILVLCCQAGAMDLWAQTTIDFDDVDDGTVIETHYLSLGVEFDCVSGIFCSRGDQVVARVPQNSNPSSPPNDVSVPSDGDACISDPNAVVRAIFDPTTTSASIVGISNDGDEDAFLNAYDAQGTLVDSDLVTFSQINEMLTLSVTGSISYVEFSGQGVDGGVCFDDLTFDQAVPTLPRWIWPLFVAVLVFVSVLVWRHSHGT